MSQDTLEPSRLIQILAVAWRERHGTPLRDAEALAPLVAGIVATARDAHPDLTVAPDAFVRHIADRLPADEEPAEALMKLRAADLYLAFACSRGAAPAIALFDATFAPDMRALLARARGKKPPYDELRQSCHEKLFASPSPKIAEYAGQGDLKSWLRVLLVRMLVDGARKVAGTREVSGGEQPFVDVPAPSDDPELDYLKRLYTSEFKQAFDEAAIELAPEDRNVLRHHYGQGLTIDQIGAVYHVHRATAARRVAKARDALLSGTRQRLMARLTLSRAELDSVMRMIESDIHLSLHRVLGSSNAVAG